MTAKITVRIPTDLHTRVVAAAQADRRSLNGEILWLLEQALTQR
ncbi:MAG TPA: Arc family DNA-binding protein [Mycobacteriales bacterium]|nr:Arc family DNA-binding protein [Mycobacteriales bacterium]